jgi:Homeodomain-like domain-containing protein
MRNGVSFTVTADDRRCLDAIVSDRSAPQKHVWRARIILFSGEGLGTSAIMAASGKSKTCVWRWQDRFMREGARRAFLTALPASVLRELRQVPHAP